MMVKSALIVVDVQYDFLPPDGTLAVPDGREILPHIEDLLDADQWGWEAIIASQDNLNVSKWGYVADCSVLCELKVTDGNGREYVQTLWPDHCVQGTKGAEIEVGLRAKMDQWGDRLKIVRKGTNQHVDAYSAFEGYIYDSEKFSEQEHARDDGLPANSELSSYLRSMDVESVVVVGLATDFCVLQTALSALSASFSTILIEPAVKGISPEAQKKALEMIESLGGRVVGKAGRDWQEELRGLL